MKTKYPKKCKTLRCRGIASKTGHSPYCSRCRSRRWKASRPLKYAFHKLRSRAKERGISFSLTFEFYELFAVKSGLDKLHGKEKYCLTVDRKDGSKGYHPENLRALTLSDNSARRSYVKYFKDKAAQEAAIVEEYKRAKLCHKISERLEKLFHPESDEFRLAYIEETNAVFGGKAD